LRVDFSNVPAERLGDWVEGVLALRRGEGAIQNALRHRDLKFHVLKLKKQIK
jgi:hypothetical protein